MNDGVRSGRIALQYPQGKAYQQQLHLRVSVKQLIQAFSAILQSRRAPQNRWSQCSESETTAFQKRKVKLVLVKKGNYEGKWGYERERKVVKPEVPIKWSSVSPGVPSHYHSLQRSVSKAWQAAKTRRRYPPPLTRQTHTLTYTHIGQHKPNCSLVCSPDHVTADFTSWCCPKKPGRNGISSSRRKMRDSGVHLEAGRQQEIGFGLRYETNYKRRKYIRI